MVVGAIESITVFWDDWLSGGTNFQLENRITNKYKSDIQEFQFKIKRDFAGIAGVFLDPWRIYCVV